MKRFALLLCLVPVALTQVVDPRGARPVEHGTRSEKCAAQREWPFCLDVDWGSKCPSGCRIQGLMDKNDHELLKKVERIRNLLDRNRAKYRSTDQVSKQTYNYLKEKLTLDSGNDNSYYDLAQNLRQRISDLKVKIDRQLRILGALKDRVRDQVTDMQRLEVDIDIKLRSCKGSCSGYVEHRVDLESYVSLNKQVQQLATQSAQRIETVGSLYVMKSRPLKDVLVSSIYKSKDVAGQQKEDMFPEVNTVQLVLEAEGSSSSPATISKVPVCARLRQQKQDGRHPSSPAPVYGRRRCSRRSRAPLCSDDDWVSRCPSGCRLQALMSQLESDLDRKLRRVCKKAKMLEDASEKQMSAVTRVYNSNRKAVVGRFVSELKFVDRAQGLAGNLTALRGRSAVLAEKLKQLSLKVKRQVDELYRIEVDVDMKLRTCRGSCHSVLPFGPDPLGYRSLSSILERQQKGGTGTRPPPGDLPRIRLKPVDGVQAPSAEYKAIPVVQRELLTQFEDIGQSRLVTEESPDGNLLSDV